VCDNYDSGALHELRKKHRDKGEALIFSSTVGSFFAMLMVQSGATAEGLVFTGIMAILMAVGWWL